MIIIFGRLAYDNGLEDDFLDFTYVDDQKPRFMWFYLGRPGLEKYVGDYHGHWSFD